MQYRDEVEMDLWRNMDVERAEILSVVSRGSAAVMAALILMTVATMVR